MPIKNIWKMLGPGLLYAGAAIGVSHLVQSTRAGAQYGLYLVWAIVVANILKFPFFEFGPRYAAATGESLLEGYQNLGRWSVTLFSLLTISTMFIIQAAITAVTAGLAQALTGIELGPITWSALILSISMFILAKGHYSLLNKMMKFIIITLAATTIFAVFSLLFRESPETLPISLNKFSWSKNKDIYFLIALMGWMPAPLDISVWHSLWSLAKNKENKNATSIKESLLDFHIGYWGTAILAICFLTLGAIVMHSTGLELEASAVGFAKQLVSMYTTSIGSWSYPIIAIASFTTMLSTSLTVLDAYPRVMRRITLLTFPNLKSSGETCRVYWGWLLFTGVGAMIVISFFMQSMKQMVDIATILSFVTAPILAVLNYLAINGKNVPEKFRPGKKIKLLCLLGFLYLLGFNIFYLRIKFF